MDIENILKDLKISENNNNFTYIDAFKNPNNLSINQIHLERTWNELRKGIPKDIDLNNLSAKELYNKYLEKRTEIIPALDKRWLPKCVLHQYEPYSFTLPNEENISFITNNLQFIDTLNYLIQCSFHQFWCTILFEPTVVLAIRSFILNPISPFEVQYLEDEYAELYKTVFNNFLLVYERLLTFKESEREYMSAEFAMKNLLDKKLLNLPIVITLAFLYKDCNLEFVNKVTSLYFNDTSQLDFQIKEVEEMIRQSLIVLEMIGGHVCGFDENATIVPISVEHRPKIFSLSWVYSVVIYLLNTIGTLEVLFQFYKPAVEIALNKELPYRLPFMYVSLYKQLYEMLDEREELKLQKDLSDKIFNVISMGRSEFIDVFHVFISFCLDETLKHIGNTKQQENVIETYLNLLTTALEDDYFICDYNAKYNVSIQNEMFESCYPLDSTRTEFIVSCINKLARHKRLEQVSKLQKKTIEGVFKEFKPPVKEKEETFESQPGPSTESNSQNDWEIEEKIKNIVDMFPHLGDGFVLKCLEAYNFVTSDVINAVLEENLPPHLYEIPFDSIRIPPEPEPEKPVLAYKGKKPEYDDALKLLNDKKDMKQIKTFVLEGVQYSNDYLYDDEYDDRYDNDVPINVADNPLSEDIPTFNPNHQEDLASDTSYTSDDDYDDDGKPVNKTETNGRLFDKSKLPFCEDPAKIRERREARYRSNHPQPQKKGDVVGKAKGQGQDKNVLLSRQKKSVNKSSRANHNRKGGAQFKRNKGMIPS